MLINMDLGRFFVLFGPVVPDYGRDLYLVILIIPSSTPYLPGRIFPRKRILSLFNAVGGSSPTISDHILRTCTR